ncbi:GerAB/ArcD/ProY family transporter [Bacillus thuringiensis]|nr:GerAB/ArcD/ProY family transporter [Bacillus thuringiensis]
MKINLNQLFILIVLFEIGSTTLSPLGIETLKQDTWIAVLIAFIIGFGSLWMYTEIQKYYYNQHLGGILNEVLGKIWAKPIILLYALYFIYIACLNLYEFGMTNIITILPETPIQVILAMIVILIVYIVVFLNIGTLARTSEILGPFFLIFLLAVYLLTFLSGNFKMNNLLPILEHPINIIISTAIFKIFNFPFGEMVVFLVYWKYVSSKQKIQKNAFVAYGLACIFIIFSLNISIAILGVSGASIAQIPLFNVIQKINISNFINRLDPLGISIIFIGGFFKIILHFYAGLILLQYTFKFINSKGGVLIVCILFYFLCILQFHNFILQRWIGVHVMIPYVHTIFQIIIPGFIFIILKIKFRVNGKQ